MKKNNQILFYTLTLVGLALLEILLPVLYRAFPPRSLLGEQLIYHISRTLAVIPPFLMLGTAVGAVRARSFSHSLIFFFLYAGILLFTQVPLSLLSYAAADTAVLYGPVLLSYMLSTALECLLFFLLLVLAYALFLQGKSSAAEVGRDTRLFSLATGDARAILLTSLLLAAYNLVQETLRVLEHLKLKLYVLSGEDVFDITLAFFFIFFLAFFCFVTGRVASRLFPTAPADEENADADFIESK
jgi:hypothetical protein